MADTDTLSFFLRRRKKVVENFQKYFKDIGKINISIINHYEVLGGLKPTFRTSFLKSKNIKLF